MADESYENVIPKAQSRTPPDGGNNVTYPELYENMNPPLPQRKPNRPPSLPPKKSPSVTSFKDIPSPEPDPTPTGSYQDLKRQTVEDDDDAHVPYEVEDYTEPVETFPGRHVVLSIQEMRSLIQCADSICYIQIQSFSCTAFRVGSKYILTNLNFIEKFLGKSTEGKKSSSDLSIQVNFVPPGENPDTKRKNFNISAEAAFVNKDLNVAILTMKKRKGITFEDFPKPLTISRRDTEGPNFLRRTVHVVGYDRDGQILDNPCFLLHRNDSLISKSRALAEQLLPRQHDFSDIFSSKHALFYCNLPEEMTGSPVLVTEVGSPRPKVCAMICRRYPTIDYSVGDTKKAQMPATSVFHQGLKMKALYECIKNANPKLRDDIFSD